MPETPFATEIIRELKAQNKRMFIVNVIQLIIILLVIGIFIWYISLPVEEITIENDSGNTNYIGNNLEGDLHNGEDS